MRGSPIFATLLFTPRRSMSCSGARCLVNCKPQCAPPNECLFADFSSNAHNLAFDKGKDGGLGARFASLRIGDGETVEGKRIHE